MARGICKTVFPPLFVLPLWRIQISKYTLFLVSAISSSLVAIISQRRFMAHRHCAKCRHIEAQTKLLTVRTKNTRHVDFPSFGQVDRCMRSAIIPTLAPKSQKHFHKTPLWNQIDFCCDTDTVQFHTAYLAIIFLHKCPMSTTCSRLSNVISSAKIKDLRGKCVLNFAHTLEP